MLAVRGAEPNPLTPFPVKEGGTEKIWDDDRSWMRRLGTGTGFAARSCPRSFHCGRVAPFGQDDRFGGRVARFSVTDCVARFGQDDGSASVANVAAVLVYFFEPFGQGVRHLCDAGWFGWGQVVFFAGIGCYVE